MKIFISTFVTNFFHVFKGKNIYWHFLAIILTYFIVVTNFDWNYFLSTRNGYFNPFFLTAIPLGGLLPILLPLVLIAIGTMSKKRSVIFVGWMLAEAAILGSLISSIYKAFTGRIQPNLHDTLVNISHGFQFGFWRHGIFWGWPSSHTTIAFAMAVSLIYLFPKNKLTYVGLFYAFYVGIGVSLAIHWFSEFIAGAIIGSVIGAVVGRSFRKRIDF